MKITKRQLRKIIKEAMPKGGVPDIVGAITGVYGEKNRRERSRAGETAWPPRAPARQHYWKDSKTGKQYWVTKEELKALEKGLSVDEVFTESPRDWMTVGREMGLKEQFAKTWKERQAEMAAWEKKLAAALPEDPSKMSNADHKKVAQVFIDEYGLDAADAFYEDDRGTLADLGVEPYPDLENIRMEISRAQDAVRKANIAKSPDKKELKAIDDGLEPREVPYLVYQPIRRGGKVVAFMVEDRETPFGTMPLGNSEFVVNEKYAKQNGTTIDKIIKMLEKHGATLRKRRKPIKRTTPYYD